MATLTATKTKTQPKQIRLFSLRTDLSQVADLIEQCFASTLDDDGIRYLRQMRATAGRSSSFFNRAILTTRYPIPMTGFVWEEDGEIIGNLSLIPFIAERRQIYLIANVAVHPDHRRRGIARMLTAAALEKLESSRIKTVWLQVRDDNPIAIELYTKMGFELISRRTRWVVKPRQITQPVSNHFPPRGTQFYTSSRESSHWKKQHSWLNSNYPVELRWQLQLKTHELQPGILGWFNRMLGDQQVLQWSVLHNNELQGVLTWQSTYSSADRIWLAAPEENDTDVLQTILPKLTTIRSFSRPMALNYPTGRASDTLKELGFTIQHTLLWMKIDL